MVQRLFKAAVVCLLAAMVGLPAWGQQAAGLTGTVSDPTGAVIPGAEVILTNEGTGATRTTTTGSDGHYIFTQLAPATYRIEVRKDGFRTAVREHLPLPVGITSAFDVELEVGKIAEEVVVEATTAGVNTVDASRGDPFGGSQVLNLPMLDRDPVGLLSLQTGVTFIPGSTPQGFDDDSRSGSVSGSRSDQTNVTLDGVDVNDPQFGFAFTSVLRPTLDSLQEFRVTTSNYNADLGRSSAAQVSLVTKSGTNTLHGSAYWLHRNEAFAAGDWFLNRAGQPKRKERRHIFGGSLGGPIVKDRFFLFGNYEEERQARETSALRDIPSMSFRDGVLIYQCEVPALCPGGTVAGLAGSHSVPAGSYGLTPAELAAIDPLGIGPNLAAIAHFQLFPTPNDPGTFDEVNFVGFRFGTPIDNTLRTYILRADFNIDRAAKHTVYWRGNLQDDSVTTQGPQFAGLDPNQVFLGANKGFALGYTALFSPTTVNTFRWGLTRIKEQRAGLQQAEFVDFRFIDNLEGYHPNTSTRTLPLHHFRDDVTLTRGRHSLSFGADVRYARNSTTNNAASFSFFILNPSWLPNVGRNVTPGATECVQAGCTAVPAVASGFQAAYRDTVVNMLGIITQSSAQYNFDRTGATLPVGDPIARRYAVDEYEIYLQDQWRATPSLTLTYGVRYFVTSPPWETNGNQVTPNPSLGEWFDTRRQFMLSGIPSNRAPQISFDLGGPENNRFGYYAWDWNNWSPRLAAAWAPRYREGALGTLFGDGKTVIRGGYSLVYDRIGNGLATSFDQFGAFGMSTSIDSTFGGCDEGAGTAPLGVCPRFTSIFAVPSAFLPPSPGGGFPTTPPGADTFGVPQPGSFAITHALDDTIKTPYAHVFNVSITRRLPWDMNIEAAYVGRRGRNLLVQRDLAMPADLCDSASGMCYFEAAQQLIGAFSQGQDILSLGSIPYWENLFPSFGPGGINGGSLVCDLFGVGGGGYTATQVAYDWVNCVHPDTTVFPWLVDNFGFPGYVVGGAGDIDIDGDGIPDAPFAYFDDQYAALNAWSSIARSEYHAFQLAVRKQMSDGVAMGFNYTLAKSRDHGSTAERQGPYGFFAGGYTGFLMNSWDPDLSYSYSDFDMRHNVNTHWNVELPFGHGKALGSDMPGWANQILGGWQISGVLRWNSGLPASVINARVWPTNWNVQGNATCVSAGADLFGASSAPCPGTQNTQNPVNGVAPNLFRDPQAIIDQFRFSMPGEIGQRNELRADGYFTMDFGLGKSFQMPWENHRFHFRWEVFNLTNSVYFDAVSLSASIGRASTFGSYTDIMGDRRLMQVTLRYDF